MASCETSETSLFSLSGVRERMREKKKGALRTAKLNASLASKIKTKIINNSSTIKVSLKHNNKALALALNAEKANAQRLTQDKAILQKEMEQCHFQNAVLRHRLSLLENALNEVENIAAAVRTARLSEFCMSSVSSSNGQKCSMTEDSWDNDIADGQLVRAAGMLMRVPISKLCDSGQQGSHSIIQASSQHLQRPASNESPETVPVASKDTLPPQPAEKPQSHQEENGKKPTEAMETQEILHESHIFGEALCATQQKPNNFPEHAWQSHSFSYEGDEMTKQFSDRLSQRHITQRRRRSTLFATSTPSSGVDISSRLNSAQAAQWSTTRDRSSSSMSNTQPQLTSHSSLLSLTETAVIPHRKSLGKEIFCDQPQAKETECSAKTDPSYSQVPEFVHVKTESKGKTVEKTSVKKAMTEKKKTNAIKANAESSSDVLQIEESAQNAKQFLQPEIPTCCSESEVYEMRKKVSVGTSNRNNTGFQVEQHSCCPDKLRDFRRTYVVNPAQLHSLRSDDLLEQGKKEVNFKIQSMESLSKSPVCASQEAASDDSSVQNLLQSRKETSTACALPEDSSTSKKSLRQKTKRKTRVIRQRDCSDEENILNTVKIPGAKAEEQPEISQTSRKKAALITTTAFRDREVGFGPCIGVGGVAKESTEDSSGNLKCSRKTYIIHPFDFAGNLGCAQTEFEGGEILPVRSVSGSKASKIPRVHRMVGAHRSKEERGVPEAEGQAEVAKTMSASEKRAYPKLKSQRKRNISRPPEPDSLARQSDGTKAVVGSSAECASEQTSLRGELSCVTDLPSVPDTFLKEQIAEISLTNNLLDLSESLESSPVTCPAPSRVNSSLADVPVSKSLHAGGNRSPVSGMPEKSSVWLGSSLTFKEKAAEEIPGKRNQIEPSSQSSPPQEPEKMPLQNLTNTRTLSSSSEVSRRSARKRQDPGCYQEPKLNRKLRRGDPFTNTAFLSSPIYKKQKTAKAKETTTKMKQNSSLEECPGVKTGMLIVTGRDMEPEVK